MKRLLPALFFIMLAGFVSATGVSYHPNKEAFVKFLDSNLTYRVIPGGDPWSKGWADYVDWKLSTIKEHGNDTLVLVGNVYTNEMIARIWNETGLDPSLSTEPAVIVLNNTVLITGSQDNLYMTYEPFSKMREVNVVVIILAIVAYVITMAVFLKDDGSYAGSTFLIGAILLAEWAFLEPISPSLFKTLYLALARLNGAPVGDVSIVFLSGLLRFLPPDETLLWGIRWLLIFILLGVTAYTSHRRERSLGIMAFLLTLSAPSFREWLLTSNDLLGLLSFSIVVALVCSSSLGESSFLMGLLTVLGMIFNPYLAFLPIVFTIAFRREWESGVYLALSVFGFILLYLTFGWTWLSQWWPSGFHANALIDVAREGLLQLVVLAYMLTKGGISVRRCPEIFVCASTMLFLLFTPFKAGLLPYSLFSLSVLSVRLIGSRT